MRSMRYALALCAILTVVGCGNKQQAAQGINIDIFPSPVPAPSPSPNPSPTPAPSPSPSPSPAPAPAPAPAPGPQVTGVTVSPQNPVVSLNNLCVATVPFVANVTGTGSISQAVSWTVVGGNSQTVSITSNGVLTVSTPAAINSTLRVVATSNQNNSVSGQSNEFRVQAGDCGTTNGLTVDYTPAGGPITVGQNIPLNAVCTPSPCPSLSWTTGNSSIVFVGPGNGPSVTITGVAPGNTDVCVAPSSGNVGRTCHPWQVTVTTTTTAPTCTLSASTTTSGGPGQPVQLFWNSTNTPTSWNASWGSVNQVSGSVTVTPSTTTTYTFTATNSAGTCPTASVTVVVNGNTNVTCTWNASSGQQNDGSVNITLGQAITATAVCTNQSGQQILPAWYSLDPNIVEVRGTQQTTINGKLFETGWTANIRGLNRGTTSVCVQPALTQQFPAFCRTVRVQ